ncbi:MAG: hypothetical protein WEB19_01995 [Acidimicrobiia bacterium]
MTGTDLIRPIPIWALRIAWLTLPVTAGPAAASAPHGWSDAPRIVAEVLLWLSWGIGLLATLAPRPPTLGALRTIAPAFFVLAVIVAIDGAPSTLAVVGALVATVITAVLAAGTDIAIAAANSIAYGDELRVPLRTPPALFLGPLPLARVMIVASVVAPALLLADDQVLVGVIALVVGVALLLVLSRALYGLTRRWAVLVPAGFVVVDPMTLADPVLFVREHITALGAADLGPSPEGVTDLRLGATRGSISVQFDEEAEITRAARGRRPAETVRALEIRIATVRRDELLANAATRRLRVR